MEIFIITAGLLALLLAYYMLRPGRSGKHRGSLSAARELSRSGMGARKVE